MQNTQAWEDTILYDPLGMDRIISPINYEELFQRSAGAKVLNQGHLISKQLSSEYIKNVFSNTDAGIPYVPKCECGKLQGQFFLGMKCHACNTEVSTKFVDKLSHQCWLSIPDELPPVLHPNWYYSLHDWTLVKKGLYLLDLALDPNREVPKELSHLVPGQGYTYFAAHADELIQLWVNYFAKKKYTVLLAKFYGIYRNIMFTRKLPLVHSSLHPMMKGGDTICFADPISKVIVKAAWDLSAITFKLQNTTTTLKNKDGALYSIYQDVLEYYDAIIKNKIGVKSAIVRKHCLGSRCHFTARTVIAPIPGAHQFEEIHLPWKIVVDTFKLEIINCLVNRKGYSVSTAVAKQVMSMVQYDAEIHQILLDLMKENPYGGFPFLMGRNPTLQLFSIQLLFCSTIKTDLEDQTIGMSSGNVTGMNADYDGDALWLLCIKEMDMVKQLMSIHPREAVLDTNSLKVSNLLRPTNQQLIQLENFLHQNGDSAEFEILKEVS